MSRIGSAIVVLGSIIAIISVALGAHPDTFTAITWPVIAGGEALIAWLANGNGKAER